MERMSMALLIGRGSRIEELLTRQHNGLNEHYQIVKVVSHKKLDLDEGRNKIDVPGIRLAKEFGIEACYFNLAQERSQARGIFFDNEYFTHNFYQRLGKYLSEPITITHEGIKKEVMPPPQWVIMSGWDLVLPRESLVHFPTENPDVFRFVNTHPSILPDEPGAQFVTISSGLTIPVLRGEHDDVLREALRQRLPVLGVTAHLVTTKVDDGGYIVMRREIPIESNDTFASYDERLAQNEGPFLVDLAESLGRGHMRLVGTKVYLDTV